MTWVIGRAGPFGYSVGLSDIRITFNDGTELDCLQKIHRVSSSMALGFAGSVAIGLHVVEELSEGLRITESNSPLDPTIIAKYLHIGTTKIFREYPLAVRKQHCHLILLSAHPSKNDGAAPWAKCYVYKLYDPEFLPVEAVGSEIVSIGSGSSKEIVEYSRCHLSHKYETN